MRRYSTNTIRHYYDLFITKTFEMCKKTNFPFSVHARCDSAVVPLFIRCCFLPFFLFVCVFVHEVSNNIIGHTQLKHHLNQNVEAIPELFLLLISVHFEYVWVCAWLSCVILYGILCTLTHERTHAYSKWTEINCSSNMCFSTSCQ